MPSRTAEHEQMDENVLKAIKMGKTHLYQIQGLIGYTGAEVDRSLQRHRRNGKIAYVSQKIGWNLVNQEELPNG